MCRWGTRGHGLVVDLPALGYWMESVVLMVFYNPNYYDSTPNTQDLVKKSMKKKKKKKELT